MTAIATVGFAIITTIAVVVCVASELKQHFRVHLKVGASTHNTSVAHHQRTKGRSRLQQLQRGRASSLPSAVQVGR